MFALKPLLNRSSIGHISHCTKPRPILHSTFRYRFDIVMDGHPQDPELQQALTEMREWTREVRIFGSYPATGDH